MAKIKIISNPYQKMTVFQCWDEALKQWHSIDADSNADRKIDNGEITKGG